MTFFDSIILGIIEGFSEYLPISSTGHLILVSQLLGIQSDNFLKSFEISIQLGAILSVVVLYWRKFFTEWEVLKKIAVAFVPTGIIGFVFYKIFKLFLLGSTAVVLWALLLGGVAIILFELWRPNAEIDLIKTTEPSSSFVPKVGLDEPEIVSGSNGDRQTTSGLGKFQQKNNVGIGAITLKQSFFIGAMQSISIIPGVSRAAATIIGGLIAGVSRKTIVEFSFLLAVPTMLAASGYDFLKNFSSFSASHFELMATGFIMAFLVGMLVVKLFLKYITKHNFIVFGIYRVLIALLFFWTL